MNPTDYSWQSCMQDVHNHHNFISSKILSTEVFPK